MAVVTARRLDLTIAAVGILVLGAAAAGAAGRAWYHALTVPGAADRLAYQDATVALLALGLLGLYPLSTTILTLVRPATRHSSRRAGTTPVESRRAGRRSGSRRTSRALRRGGARLVRHKTAGGGPPRSSDLAAAGSSSARAGFASCPHTIRYRPGRATIAGGAR